MRYCGSLFVKREKSLPPKPELNKKSPQHFKNKKKVLNLFPENKSSFSTELVGDCPADHGTNHTADNEHWDYEGVNSVSSIIG